jgi:ABC-type multidrug transport system ATPase subunit
MVGDFGGCPLFGSLVFTDMNFLQADSIQKAYKNRRLLSDVFLRCQTGEIVGVFGPNGSGKSTLFKIMFGIVSAESRFVKVGQRVLRSAAQTRKYINYLPEHGFLPGQLKVRTAFDCYVGASLPEGLNDDIVLRHLLPKKVSHLSFGERRLVEVLLVLYSRAPFALLDEPFKGLGPLVRDQITGHIQMVKPTKGLIIADHDVERICEISDTLMLLKTGFLKTLESRRELKDLGYLPEEPWP